jgi:hypothetical protein
MFQMEETIVTTVWDLTDLGVKRLEGAANNSSTGVGVILLRKKLDFKIAD